MTTIINGSSPSITFSDSTTQASAGVVLQVVNATYSTQVSTASTTPVTTNLTASITPKFFTSKILVIVTASGYANTAGVGSLYTIYRNSTNLNSVVRIANGGNNINAPIPVSALDSPATTSATSYSLYMYTNSATAYINTDGTSSSITLMEIAG